MNTPINFEIAKLLFRKHYKSKSKMGYDIMGNLGDPYYGYHFTNGIGNGDLVFEAPTIAEVVKWLYDKHGIFVTVNIPYEEFGKFSAEIWGKNLDDGIKILLADGMSMFDSIEKAYEEGIEHCLVNLI